MSDPQSAYTFLPWLRQGISTAIDAADGTPVPGRASVKAAVAIGGGSESTTPVEVAIDLFGPRDVRALDVRAITRHWPRPDVFEVEPNYFPLLEIFPADLLWRYTPARANAQDRLRPWLALIALRDDEIDSLLGPSRTLPVATLTTKPGAPLPPADQLWAWAHAHVDAADSVDAATLQSILDDTAHHVVGRLLCPRRLDPRTYYTALLVPALEAARLAALGQPVDPALDATRSAWQNDGAAVQLPVFYQWRFQTGDAGDFESLARRIVAQPLPPTAGARPTDVSQPGMGLPAAATAPLAAASALRALDAAVTAWPATDRQAWTTALAALVDLPDERLRQPGAPRTLAPPLYGCWYAATASLDPTAPPPWFQDLNADPGTRIAAALGWQAVQSEQQQLLAGAWAQVGAVRAANATLRQAQLAREAALRLYQRHVLKLAPTTFAVFTQPVQARVLMTVAAQPKPVTVRALVAGSPLRAGVLQPAFTRLTRPLGPLAVRQARPLAVVAPSPSTPPPAPGTGAASPAAPAAPATLLDRVNTGQLRVAPPPPPPQHLATPALAAAADVAPSWVTPQLAAQLSHVPSALWLLLEQLVELLLSSWPAGVAPPSRQALAEFLAEIQQATAGGGSPADDLARRLAARDGALTPQQIQSAPPRPGFVAQELQPDGTLKSLAPGKAPEDTRFRTAVAAAFGAANAVPAAGELLAPLDLAAATAALQAALDPHLTVAATFAQRLGLRLPWAPTDPLSPVMAAPAFAQPMYEPLNAISTEWILAGFGALPTDVASLAHPNERFIESYMVGANDEMGRTLLFNEYPTDQRGSYFLQFWDPSATPAPAPDLQPLAQWPRASALGTNGTRPGIDTYLVLIVRAELLRRFPNTVVYAVQAQWNANGTRSVPQDSPTLQHPSFQGVLGADARFWGFSLTTAEARGGTSPSQPAGWYFAIQEHTSEPRFGLEPAAPAGSPFATAPPSWQALAWSDLAPDADSLARIAYIDLAAALPNVAAVADPQAARWHAAQGARASDLAYISFREPARVLVHASRMIPADA